MVDINDGWRVDLVDGGEFCAGQHRLDRTTAVLRDEIGVIAAAVADVEAPDFAFGDAALSTEEAVGNREQVGAQDFDLAHSASFMMMSSSACSPTMKW